MKVNTQSPSLNGTRAITPSPFSGVLIILNLSDVGSFAKGGIKSGYSLLLIYCLLGDGGIYSCMHSLVYDDCRPLAWFLRHPAGPSVPETTDEASRFLSKNSVTCM